MRPDIDKKFGYVLDEGNRQSSTTVKVVWDASEAIGYITHGLSKVITSDLKDKIVLTVETEVVGHLKENGRLDEASKLRVFTPCIIRKRTRLNWYNRKQTLER